jgi:hypothetical protein
LASEPIAVRPVQAPGLNIPLGEQEVENRRDTVTRFVQILSHREQ